MHSWLRTAVWIALLGALILGVLFMVVMPGRSFSGPLPPLNDEEKVLRDNLKRHVATIAGTIGERNMWHYQALDATRDYVTQSFNALGYTVAEQPFMVYGKRVWNLEVIHPGETLPDEIVLVGAHYDSVRGSPGANDNATGVAAVIEIARLLADQKHARTVRLVAFVNEEPPFFYTKRMGSRVYVRRAAESGEQIVAMLSLETIGYYTDTEGSQHYPFPFGFFYPSTGNFVGFVGNLRSRDLVHRAIGSFRRHTLFPSEGTAAPGWLPGIGWSDHWAFWKEGYPAIMITDTALYRYAEYHTFADRPEIVDYERLARVVGGLARVVVDLAGGEVSGFKRSIGTGEKGL